MKQYDRTLALLRTTNSRASEAFRQSIEHADAASIGALADRIEEMIRDPRRQWWPPLRANGPLAEALGFEERPGGFVYAGPRTPAVRAELALAARALRAYELAKKAADAEPPLGAAGTATILAVRDDGTARRRRRFHSSDTLADVLGWLGVEIGDISNPAFEPEDIGRSLQALDMWPGAEIRLRREERAQIPFRAHLEKGKPSDLIKAITRRFDDNDDDMVSRPGKPPATHFNIKKLHPNNNNKNNNKRLAPAPA